MSKKKTNAEYAKEFVEHLKAQNLKIFTETQPKGKYLYIVPANFTGTAGNISTSQLCQKLLGWLQAENITKSEKQIRNIAKDVFLNVENRIVEP